LSGTQLKIGSFLLLILCSAATKALHGIAPALRLDPRRWQWRTLLAAQRRSRPKQLLALFSEQTLLQSTVSRLSGLVETAPNTSPPKNHSQFLPSTSQITSKSLFLPTLILPIPSLPLLRPSLSLPYLTPLFIIFPHYYTLLNHTPYTSFKPTPLLPTIFFFIFSIF
jgi:hypothetical protein